MNEQLQTINKKIRLLNEVIALNPLFDEQSLTYSDKHMAQKKLSELVSNKTTISIFNEMEIIKVATKLRRLFENKQVIIKRKVVQDKLIKIDVHEVGTKNTMPLNPDGFINMIAKINV